MQTALLCSVACKVRNLLCHNDIEKREFLFGASGGAGAIN